MGNVKVFGFEEIQRVFEEAYARAEELGGRVMVDFTDLMFLGAELGDDRFIYIQPRIGSETHKVCLVNMAEQILPEVDIELNVGNIAGGGSLFVELNEKRVYDKDERGIYRPDSDWILLEIIAFLRSQPLFTGWDWSQVMPIEVRGLLFVDDQFCRLKDTSTLLANFGELTLGYDPYEFHYETAEDGDGGYSVQAVLDRIESLENLSVVICDMMFGTMERFGFDILTAIREKFPDLPVIMITTDTKTEVVNEIWNLGGVYLEKFPSIRKFKTTLKRAVPTIGRALRAVESELFGVNHEDDYPELKEVMPFCIAEFIRWAQEVVTDSDSALLAELNEKLAMIEEAMSILLEGDELDEFAREVAQPLFKKCSSLISLINAELKRR